MIHLPQILRSSLSTLALCLAGVTASADFLDPTQTITRTVSTDGFSTTVTFAPGLVVSRPNAFSPPAVTRDAVALFRLSDIPQGPVDLVLTGGFSGRLVIDLTSATGINLVDTETNFLESLAPLGTLSGLTLQPNSFPFPVTRDLSALVAGTRLSGNPFLKVFFRASALSDASSAAQFTARLSVVPEPASWALLSLGVLALFGASRTMPRRPLPALLLLAVALPASAQTKAKVTLPRSEQVKAQAAKNVAKRKAEGKKMTDAWDRKVQAEREFQLLLPSIRAAQAREAQAQAQIQAQQAYVAAQFANAQEQAQRTVLMERQTRALEQAANADAYRAWRGR